ncbi:unnamed protein product [Peronospora belbahrii]|uniref:Uncharacterized protein n=1 Tax=Peronospora belbahrii TaxID=622444 RepID=A0AAU9KQM8_9STRA|nr:unnamed protein product [Peronospora belbahrii]
MSRGGIGVLPSVTTPTFRTCKNLLVLDARPTLYASPVGAEQHSPSYFSTAGTKCTSESIAPQRALHPS